MKKWLSNLSIIVVSSLSLSAQASVARPPQFILLAFDGGLDLSHWREVSNFTSKMNRKQEDLIHFTFFMSGTNFLTNAHKNLYQGPKHKRGFAEIAFGGSRADVKKRINIINKLYSHGHEFGSHVVGHFDGSNWSYADWSKEFQAYRELYNNVAKNNGFNKKVKLAYPLNEVVGFRAPYLGKNAALYDVLNKNNFRYDTSGISPSYAWPKKKENIWRFNLAKLKIADTGKSTISMDYNFFMAQSNAKANPKEVKTDREQMLHTYMNYFLTNYTGNRAPINIGHHFTDFQGTAYKDALFAFAKRVCGLPEVRCVTYTELADFMDKQTPATLAAYQLGDFPHAQSPKF